MTIRDHLRRQSKTKLVLAAAIVAGLGYIVLANPRDLDYYEAVEREIGLAKKICEDSLDWAKDNRDKLKMNASVLKTIGEEPVELKYVAYPRALLFHNGFNHPGTQAEFYCTFTDPRGGAGNSSPKYFYDYETKSWRGRTMSRR